MLLDFDLYKTNDVHKTVKNTIMMIDCFSLQYKSPVKYKTELLFN